jgi:pimeloyl-ACP methyl ester carboxylesterase
MPIVHVESSLPIYYESSGSGLPIVFIHPPGMGHTVFRYQKELADSFRVITYDIRGHGNSGLNDEPVSIPLLAHDLRLLLDSIGVDKAIICGYSAGGSIAQEFALSYPERTFALILSGGYPEVSTFILKREYEAGMKMVRHSPELLAKILASSHRVTKEDEEALYNQMLRTDLDAWYDTYNASLQFRCTERLSQLECPMLLAYGQLSYYINKYRIKYLQNVRQTKVAYISKALHQLPMKNHHEFNHVLKKFTLAL